MIQIDAHYTPAELADAIVELGAMYCAEPRVVADFAAGHGSLLDAASRRWTAARIVANDIHRGVCSRLRRYRPAWSVTNANFVDHRSLRRSRLAALAESVDLTLLNPPFSQRRGDLYAASFGDSRVECGLATAFVANSLKFVRPGGCLLSILPDGCLTAQRDRAAWNLIEQICDVHVEARNPRGAFPGAFPSTSIVSMRKRLARRRDGPGPEDYRAAREGHLVRGWQQMHSAGALDELYEALPLVHTSQLKQGKVDLASARRVGAATFFQGPAVLLPRVGQITPGKVCVHASKRRVVLSDCVIAVPVRSAEDCEVLRERIVANWDRLTRCYSGTGAPYATVASLERFFLQVAFSE